MHECIFGESTIHRESFFRHIYTSIDILDDTRKQVCDGRNARLWAMVALPTHDALGFQLSLIQWSDDSAEEDLGIFAAKLKPANKSSLEEIKKPPKPSLVSCCSVPSNEGRKILRLSPSAMKILWSGRLQSKVPTELQLVLHTLAVPVQTSGFRFRLHVFRLHGWASGMGLLYTRHSKREGPSHVMPVVGVFSGRGTESEYHVIDSEMRSWARCCAMERSWNWYKYTRAHPAMHMHMHWNRWTYAHAQTQTQAHAHAHAILITIVRIRARTTQRRTCSLEPICTCIWTFIR
jgi:hypothetical protein